MGAARWANIWWKMERRAAGRRGGGGGPGTWDGIFPPARPAVPGKAQVLQVGEAGATGPHCLSKARDLLSGELVEYHQVTLRHGGREKLADVGEESLAGHGSVEHRRGDEGGSAPACDEGGCANGRTAWH